MTFYQILDSCLNPHVWNEPTTTKTKDTNKSQKFFFATNVLFWGWPLLFANKSKEKKFYLGPFKK